MKKMPLKVCGMRNRNNIQKLLQLDIDMMGFIFYPPSPRDATQKLDVSLLTKFPPSIKRVAVFVDPEEAYIESVMDQYSMDIIQFHGVESPDQLLKWKNKGYKIIKAFHVNDAFDFKGVEAYEGIADHFLFDSKGTYYGGNGVAFNWLTLQNYKGKTPFFLSGGLDETVLEKLPWLKTLNINALDVNSRFETEPGIKDLYRLEKFIENLKITEPHGV